MSRVRWGLFGAAITAGSLVPSFYDWSGADQSRASPAIPWVALSILILDAVAIAWIARIPHSEQPTTFSSTWSRFSIKQILVATTVIAILISLGTVLKLPFGRCLSLAVIGVAIWTTIKKPSLRWPIIVLFVAMWGPFIWAFTWPEFRFNLVSIALMLADVPALLLAAWTSMLFGWNLRPDSGIGGAFAAAELAAGVWMFHLGPKRGLAYTLLAFTLALFSSFGLQALVRA